MKCKGLYLALTLLLGTAAQAQLTNGSFESGTAGWSNFSATVLSPATAFSNQDGLNVARFSPSNIIIQHFTLLPNTSYVFSALVAGDAVGDNSYIRFLIGDDPLTTTLNQTQFQIGATPVGGAMDQIDLFFTTGATANTLLQIDSHGTGFVAPRDIFLDKLSISLASSTAPEPTTLALLSLGALSLVARRRSRR